MSAGTDWQRRSDEMAKLRRRNQTIGCLVIAAIFVTVWAGIIAAIFVAIRFGG